MAIQAPVTDSNNRNPVLLYVVLRPTVWEVGAVLFSVEDGAGTGFKCAYGNAGELVFTEYNFSTVLTFTGVVADEWLIVRVLRTSTLFSVKLGDGTAQSATLGAINTPVSYLNFGAGYTDSTAYSNMDLAGFLLYNNDAPTEEFETLVRQYLNSYFFGAIALPMTFDDGGPWLDNDPL